jgi:N-acetylmuramoyl-L-alanine amidase
MPALAIHDHPLPYVSLLDARPGSAIDLVVIHCTELPDLATARRYGEQVHYDSGTGNSGHYYIDYDGSVHRYVADERIAHHTRGYNPRSIGIELSNRGRWPDWLDSRRQQMDEPYTAAQIEALLLLLQQLRHDHPSLRWIAGHEELDTTEVPASDDARLRVRRKRDPGPLFPWERLDHSGLQRFVAPEPAP